MGDTPISALGDPKGALSSSPLVASVCQQFCRHRDQAVDTPVCTLERVLCLVSGPASLSPCTVQPAQGQVGHTHVCASGDPKRALHVALDPLVTVRDQSSLLRDLAGDMSIHASRASWQTPILAVEPETDLGLGSSLLSHGPRPDLPT